MQSNNNDLCGDFLRGRCQRGTACKYSHEKNQACRDFERGGCSRGESCRFSHGAAAAPYGGNYAYGGGATTPNYPTWGGSHGQSGAVQPMGQFPAAAAVVGQSYSSSNYGSSYNNYNSNSNNQFGNQYGNQFGNQYGGQFVQPQSYSMQSFQQGSQYGRSNDVCGDWIRGRCSRVECKYLHKRVNNCGDFMRGRCTRGDTCKYLHEREVCGDYLKGQCSRGDGCRYDHERTQACRDFERGSCERGSVCKYLHSSGAGGGGTTDAPPPGSGSPSYEPYVKPGSSHDDSAPDYSRQLTNDTSREGAAGGYDLSVGVGSKKKREDDDAGGNGDEVLQKKQRTDGE